MSRPPVCHSDCPGCPASPQQDDSQPAAAQALSDSCAPASPLAGGRFALSAAWVFGGPLAALIAASAALSRPMGEWAALGVGLAAGVLIVIPAAWVLRRGKECRS
ncbi:MAG: hypothetical protein BIFFINMI_01786 [Phycisphaerae bacterium]|nr:hypothetical protein [Phycisphaerae bacterium]